MPRLTSLSLILRLVFGLTLGSLGSRLGPPSANNADLWLHGVAYGGLTLILVALFGRPVICALVSLAISGTLEGLQALVSRRVSSWEDAMTNAAGVALAFIVLLCLRACWAGRSPTRRPS